ncbi:hypothetical protein [Paraburkholderia sp. BL6665CI2N2]|uniref:hypothetical protein n=1 Tax=Paraburkholderia sp. BL6665CI2N2 TaxID=1938806 RepID=UPI0010662383|nr:hypothetical protein [Paraburkholderia sp. BL6665CI2N2]
MSYTKACLIVDGKSTRCRDVRVAHDHLPFLFRNPICSGARVIRNARHCGARSIGLAVRDGFTHRRMTRRCRRWDALPLRRFRALETRRQKGAENLAAQRKSSADLV